MVCQLVDPMNLPQDSNYDNCCIGRYTRLLTEIDVWLRMTGVFGIAGEYASDGEPGHSRGRQIASVNHPEEPCRVV